jgi:hypothetical protein
MTSREENYRTLETLKAQLDFIEKGGYRIPDNALWRPPAIFLDSPTCLNFHVPHGTRPCNACILMQFVPTERLRATIPCHHIPLTEAGDTVASAEAWADQSELEDLVKAWLRRKIQQFEETLHNSPGETQSTSNQ